MNKFFTIVALTIFASSLVFSNEAKIQDSASRIVGTWKSLNDVNGEPQAVITINRLGKQLEGKFVFRGLTVKGQKNVTLDLPITNITFDGTTFSLKVTFPEPDRTVTDWELKLRNDNEASFGLIKEGGKIVEDAPSFVMKRTKTS